MCPEMRTSPKTSRKNTKGDDSKDKIVFIVDSTGDIDATVSSTVDNHTLENPGALSSVGKMLNPKNGCRFIAKETRGQGKRLAKLATEKSNEISPGFVPATGIVIGNIKEKSNNIAEKTSTQRAKAEKALGETKLGEGVGKYTRKGAGLLMQMPLLSLVPDVMNEKNGITDLCCRIQKDPNDMYLNLWLGEALRAQEHDMKMYTIARTALTPNYLLTREALRTASRLGSDSTMTPSEKYLRRAYQIAHAAVCKNPKDCEAYDVIARYYLASGNPQGGLKAAKAAVNYANSEKLAQCLMTLARMYFAMNLFDSAGVAAKSVIKAGSSLGNEILADLMYQKPTGSDFRSRMAEFGDLRSRVTPSDRIAYYGTCRTLSSTARAIAQSQSDKAKKQYKNAREAGANFLEKQRTKNNDQHYDVISTIGVTSSTTLESSL